MRQLKQKALNAHFAQIEEWYEKYAELRDSGPIEDMKAEYEAKVLNVTVPLVRLKDFLNDEYPWHMDDPQKLRDELIGDLSPIVQPSSIAEAERYLRRLLDKINELRFDAPWEVTNIAPPAPRELTPELAAAFENAKDLFQAYDLADEPSGSLSPKGRVLKIGGGKFVVHMSFNFDLDDPPTERNEFYTIILQTLIDGTFHNLKRCKECPRFFIADRLSDRFCRPECSEAFFSRGAADRVRASRAKALEKKQPPKTKGKPRRKPTRT